MTERAAAYLYYVRNHVNFHPKFCDGHEKLFTELGNQSISHWINQSVNQEPAKMRILSNIQ